MVNLLYTNPPDNYFQDEVRCDHLVTSQMKELWAIQMDLLQFFINICEKYNLGYWVIAGTLLGAIRHNGYIPWDDDIDVAMLRPDYEKFIEIVQDELPSEFLIGSIELDSLFPRFFTRIYRKGTSYSDPTIESYYQIFIDIFPIDSCPIMVDVTNLYMKYRNTLSELNHYPDNAKRNILNPLVKEIISEISNNYDQKSILLANYGLSRFLPGRIAYREDIDTLIDHNFEYITVKVPINSKRCLDIKYPKWDKEFIKGGQIHRPGIIFTG